MQSSGACPQIAEADARLCVYGISMRVGKRFEVEPIPLTGIITAGKIFILNLLDKSRILKGLQIDCYVTIHLDSLGTFRNYSA